MSKIRSLIYVSLLSVSVLAHGEVIKNQSNQNNQNILIDKPIVVPSGLLSEKPIISDATFARIAKKNNLSEKDFTEEDLKKLDAKFTKVTNTLNKEHVFEKIAKIAPRYGISPETVAACIIGEHVFNVGLVDSFQSYFVNIYSKWIDKHDSIQEIYLTFLEEPEVQEILESNNTDFEKWDTIFNLYNQKYRGRKNYPNNAFIYAFFNPMGAGLTYGLGQLSPIRVLLTNDIAVKMGGLKKINPEDTEDLYFATLDVDTNINYVAATVVSNINNYKKYANFDISQNIGVIATLYNLGEEKKRAQQLAKVNAKLVKEGKQMNYPVENFYGWYMNKKEKEIKSLVRR